MPANSNQPKLTQYALRILGSRLPSTPISDEYALVSLMKKYLVNQKSASSATELENQYNHLKRIESFSQLKIAASSSSIAPSTLRFSILYFLYQLRKPSALASLKEGQTSGISEGPQYLLISDLKLQPSSVSSASTPHNAQTKLASQAKPLPQRRIPPTELPEQNLVRDLVFVLQGLNGQYFKYNEGIDRFELDSTWNIPRPMRILALRISELGALFSKVRVYLERTQVSHSSSKNSLGLIAQSFREGIAEEVVSYYRMISVLEAQLKTTTFRSENVEESVLSANMASDSTMTLKKLAVWTAEPMRRMKWLYMVIENDLSGKVNSENVVNELVDAKRGAVHDLAASRMHQLTQLRAHGDPHLHSLGLALEVYTSRPVLNMIQNWIFQGTLNDPYKEFFIIKNDAIVPRVREVGEVSKPDESFWNWSEQYLVLHSRIPPFISHKLAHKIMVIGKSINFMKTCCGDAEWITEATKKVLLQLPSEGITQFDQLRQPIHILYETINARLVRLVVDKFQLMQQIEAIRKYLFLGQGDLIQVLMESLEPELSLPVGKQYRHNLLPIVDGAIRSSVANSWPSAIQDCCEIFIPSSKELASEGRGIGTPGAPQDGWDVFELQYKLLSPLNAILASPSITKQHRAIFRFLWRLRRIQYVLSGSWRLTTNTTRQLNHLVPEIVPLMQQVHLLRHQMTHFISNIQYYIMFEVLETAWQQLETTIRNAKSLDEIVSAYTEYVSMIIKSSLIDDPESQAMTMAECVDRGYEPELTPAAMIWEVLDLIRDFDERTQDIYTSAHEVAVRREEARQGEPEYDENGEPQWGITPEDEQADLDFLDHLDNVLCAGIDTVTDQYKHCFDQLFTSLAHRMREGDNVFLRNLFQRINFNAFYASESSHQQTNPENATAILQATLGSMRDATAGHLGISPAGSTLASRVGVFSGPHSRAAAQSSSLAPPSGFGSRTGAAFSPSLGSLGSPTLASTTTTTTSTAYTETVLKQAAAKLRLSTLASSAQNRASPSSSSK
jgi:gamma-tubulin complex component 3